MQPIANYLSFRGWWDDLRETSYDLLLVPALALEGLVALMEFGETEAQREWIKDSVFFFGPDVSDAIKERRNRVIKSYSSARYS